MVEMRLTRKEEIITGTFQGPAFGSFRAASHPYIFAVDEGIGDLAGNLNLLCGPGISMID